MQTAQELPLQPVELCAEPSPESSPPGLRQLEPGRLEPLSPFVGWSRDERAALPETDEPAKPSLLIDLLREPASIVERMLDPRRLQSLIVGALAMLLAGATFFAAAIAFARGANAARSVLAAGALALAVAAALGPIWAVGVLVAARVPMARLVASLLSSVAAGAILLAGMAPPLFLAWRLDDHEAGPLGVVLAFGVAGLASGLRLRRLLLTMAESVTRTSLGCATARLSPDDEYRVGILARMAMVLLAFTCALAVWALGFIA